MTGQEALDIIGFLLAAPKYRDITIKPEWIVDGTAIYRGDYGLLVSGPSYQFRLRADTDTDPAVARLSIAEIAVCETDVCRGLRPGER